MIAFQYAYFAEGFPCFQAVVHSYGRTVGHVIFMPVLLEGMVYAVTHNGEAGFQIKVHMCGRVQFQLEA